MTREIRNWKDRDDFCRAVYKAAELSMTDRVIITRLAFHHDIDHWQCSIRYSTLAEDVLVSERTVIRAIAKAESLGWLVIERTQGKRNNFRLLLPAEGVTSECHPPGVTKKAARGDKSEHRGVTPRCHTLSEVLTERGAYAPLSRKERDSSELALASTGDGAALTAAAPEEFEGEQEIIPPSRVPVLNHERAWRELREAWQRPHAEDQRADRKAFEVACQEVPPEDIVEVARMWVAAYAAGDGVRYLPPLWKWLGDRGWEKKPQQGGAGKRRGGNGGGRRGKPNMREICAAFADWRGNEADEDDGTPISGAVP